MNQLKKDKEFFLNNHKLSTKTPIKLLNNASFEGVSCFCGGCEKEVSEDYVRGSVVSREGIVFFDCVAFCKSCLLLSRHHGRVKPSERGLRIEVCTNGKWLFTEMHPPSRLNSFLNLFKKPSKQ